MDTLLLPNSLYVISFLCPILLAILTFNSSVYSFSYGFYKFLGVLLVTIYKLLFIVLSRNCLRIFLEKATFLDPWPMEDHDRWEMGFHGWVKVNVIKLASVIIDWQNWKRTWSVFTQLSKSTENATSLGVLPGQNGQGVTWTDMVYMYHQKEIRKQVPVGPILNYWVQKDVPWWKSVFIFCF